MSNEASGSPVGRLAKFQEVGHSLFVRGLVSSHSGNLSMREGRKLLITRRGSQLGHLEAGDIVATGISRDDAQTPLASVELPVHRAIYRQTGCQAVVHAHPPHAIALSMTDKEVSLDCADGLEFGTVPVLGWEETLQPGSLGDEIGLALKKHRIVLLYGHGSFACGHSLEEAYKYTATLEEMCQVTWLVRTLRKK